MLNLYLDPYVFSCPAPEDGLEEIERYIDNILLWQELRGVSWAMVYVTSQTYEVLAETNGYPLWADLQGAIELLSMNHVQPQDVMDVVNGLLQKTPSIEEKLHIKEVLMNNVHSEPSEHLQRRLQIYIDHYHRILVFMCLNCHITEEREENQYFITRHLSDINKSVKIFGDVEDGEFVDKHQNISFPLHVNKSFPACTKPEQLYSSLDPISLWMTVDSPESRVQALYIYVKQNEVRGLQIISWYFGSEFIKTAQELGFLREEKKSRMLFRAFAETIFGISLADTHAIRVGVGAEERQLVSGLRKAWRRDIDHEYHLHYWEGPDGIEFAAVVVHSNISIPNPRS